MPVIETQAQLVDALAAASAADTEALRSLSGDILILGAGGKMGPSLARRARNAAPASQRIIAVSRFSDTAARQLLEDSGVVTIAADLLDFEQIAKLPDAPNVIFMAGRKF